MDFDEPCEKTQWFGPSIPNEKVTGELDGNWIIWDIATWASQRVKSSLVVFSTCMEKYIKLRIVPSFWEKKPHLIGLNLQL